MDDIVKMLRAADEWMLIGLEGVAYSDDAPFEAADLIERQREVLRFARSALTGTRARLSIERKKLAENYGHSCMGVFYCDAEANEVDEAIAAIDAALKEDGNE